MKDDKNKVKIGSIVKVDIERYLNFRGTVTAIENGMATIEVPTFYGQGDKIIVHKEYKLLKLADPKK